MQRLDSFWSQVNSLDALSPGGVLVLRNPDQHTLANDLYRDSRDLQRVIEASDPYQKAKTTRVSLLAAMQASTAPLLQAAERLGRAISTYRKAEDQKIAEAARRQALVDQQQQQRTQAAEQKRLEALAKTARGAEKRDLLAEAAAISAIPMPSIDSVVANAVAQQQADTVATGAVPLVEQWHAEVDDLDLLVAHVVASSADLVKKVKELQIGIDAGRLSRLTTEALVGITRLKGVLHASPALNALARQLRAQCWIAGVRVVADTHAVNR